MTKITHIDKQGQVRMVDITNKTQSDRKAIAQALIFMSAQTLEIISNNQAGKGNVLETARIAGIMAAKKTHSLIPMCHPLNLTHVQLDFSLNVSENSIRVEGSVRTIDTTGVEMEALVAVSIAALTVYDMCKSYDKAMNITDICLLKKSGGESGTFTRY